MGKKKQHIDFENDYIKDLGADMPVKKIDGTLKEHLSMISVAFVPILILATLYAFVLEPAFRTLFLKPATQESVVAVPITETVPEAQESAAAGLKINTKEEHLETTAGACQVWMSVRLNGTELQRETRYSIKPNDTIGIHAGSSKTGIAKIGYYSNLNEEIRDTFDENVSITVPKHPSGTAVVLVIEAVADNDDGTPNTVTKTGWEKYYFVYE